jgi:tetratricopeptide (TPR) repeat protein
MTTNRPALPSIWHIPYQQNPFFTGREEVLTHLHASLQIDATAALTQPQGLSGLGGIGKTQMALEYVYRYRHDYQAVLWARADSEYALFSDFIFIAHVLDLPEKDEADQRRIVEAVMRWLRVHTGWLLVLDNIEDLAVAAPFIPLAGHGHVLLTTRAKALGGIAERIEIEKMTPEVGALFLLRRAGFLSTHDFLDMASEADRHEAMSISRLVDGFPLALDQAGAYIKETACGLSNYFTLYQARSTDLLRVRGSFTSDYPHSVVTTWSLSFEKITQAHPAAADLLDLCAFLYPDAIPEEIITDGAADLGPQLEPIAVDPLQLDGAIKEILRYSLIQREAERQTLTIHRLVQAVLKDRMEENVQRQWARRTVRAVNETFPEVEFTSWPRCQRCILHAQVCAIHVEQWDMEFPEATRLLNQAGYYLEERAQYLEAEPLYLRALAIRERTLGLDHLDTAQSLNNLASLYEFQGKYEEAVPLYQGALEVRERTAGPDHPDTAQSLNNLAELYRVQGKYKDAEPLYLRALAIWEQALGSEDPETASCLNNLGLLYDSLGRREEAVLCFHRALAIDETVFGTDHPHVSTDLNNLAELYRAQGKSVEAEPLLQRALTIWEQIDPNHPDTAVALNSLAELYRSQGKYKEAKSLLQRALTIWEQVDLDHPDVAVSLNNLALLYNAEGEKEQAESFFQKAFVIQEKALGPDHPDTARYFSNLAGFYEGQGKFDQAVALYQRALKTAESSLGSEHPYVTTLSRDYTEALRKKEYNE